MQGCQNTGDQTIDKASDVLKDERLITVRENILVLTTWTRSYFINLIGYIRLQKRPLLDDAENSL